MLRLSGFWISNPNAWFVRVEAQFDTRRIREHNDTKYEYLLSALPEEVIVTVMDILWSSKNCQIRFGTRPYRIIVFLP